MSGKESLTGALPKYFGRTRSDFSLRAPHIRQQSAGGKRRPQAFDQIDDRNNRSRENDDVAAAYRIGGMGNASVYRALILRTLQHRSAIAANNAAAKALLLQREAERAANQAGSDDGDLAHALRHLSSNCRRDHAQLIHQLGELLGIER